MLDNFLGSLKGAGLRKVATALYMFTVCAVLLAMAVLPAIQFAEISRWLILAIFAGNALEHYVGKMESKKEEKDVA